MPKVSVFVFIVMISWTSALPAKIPSTSLNLPIHEAAAQGDTVEGHLADTPNDRSKVETTFKEPVKTDFIHTQLSNLLHPTPIVDGIKEKEKYGNDGTNLEGLGNFIVRGTEVATQFIGTAVGYPKQIFQTASGRVTAALNRVGSSLIGL